MDPRTAFASSWKYSASSQNLRREVLVVRLVSVELNDQALAGADLTVTLRVGNETHRVPVTHMDTQQRLTWDLNAGSDLFVSLHRKRVVGSTLLATCGPIPTLELGVQGGPRLKRFQLTTKDTKRIGKIQLELSLAPSDDERNERILRMHTGLLKRLADVPRECLSSSALYRDVAGTAASAGKEPDSLPTSRGSGGGGGVGGSDHDSDDVVAGYLDPSDSSFFFLASSAVPRFDWVLGSSQRQVDDAVHEVQRSFKRLTTPGVTERLVTRFFERVSSGASMVAGLLAVVDEEDREDKMIDALAVIVGQLRNPAGPDVEKLKRFAVEHIGDGLDLSVYNDVGCALLYAIREAESGAGTEWNEKLDVAWRLGVTLATTTMLEAAKPLQAKAEQLPPGLELLGGDGVFPAQYYQFNERFQRAVEELWKGREVAWETLAEVCDDFESVATTMGRLIICDQFVVQNARTVKPQALGGTIGGIKYCHQGVFFKFALPDGKYILTHKAAEKVAGHELKNCSSYFQAGIDGLHVPLMCVVEYGGYRLVASCVLPISKATLCVGTSDGGSTIRANDAALLRKLKEAAVFLNLKEHAVGQATLPSAADVEGHFSPTDKRHYLVDFSRALPPDIESVRQTGASETMYSRLLRPELVMRCKTQLNPDAFSGFKGMRGEADSTAFENDCTDVANASKMVGDQLKLITAELERLCLVSIASLNDMKDLASSLSRLFHFVGVNMRYLGAAVQATSSQALQSLFFVEMAARVIKHHVKKQWRDQLSTAGFAVTSTLQRVMVLVFTDLFDFKSAFWRRNVVAGVEEYFRVCWPDKEKGKVGPPEPIIEAKQPSSRGSKDSSSPRLMKDVLTRNDTVSYLAASENPLVPRRSTTSVLMNRNSSSELEVNMRIVTRKQRLSLSEIRATLDEDARELQSVAEMAPWALPVLVHRVCSMLQAQLSKRLVVSVDKHTGDSPIVVDSSDFVSIAPKCKTSNIATQGRAMSILGKSRATAPKAGAEVEFLGMASDHFESALSGPLVSANLLTSYASCLMQLITTQQLSCTADEGRRVDALFAQALALSPTIPQIHFRFAKWMEQCQKWPEARLAWLKGLSLVNSPHSFVPGYIECLRQMQMREEAARVEAIVATRAMRMKGQ